MSRSVFELLRLIVNINKRSGHLFGSPFLSSFTSFFCSVNFIVLIVSRSLRTLRALLVSHRANLLIVHIAPFRISFSWSMICPPKSHIDSKSVDWCAVTLRNEWVVIALIFDPKLTCSYKLMMNQGKSKREILWTSSSEARTQERGCCDN